MLISRNESKYKVDLGIILQFAYNIEQIVAIARRVVMRCLVGFPGRLGAHLPARTLGGMVVDHSD